jgi:hypothetical protein
MGTGAGQFAPVTPLLATPRGSARIRLQSAAFAFEAIRLRPCGSAASSAAVGAASHRQECGAFRGSEATVFSGRRVLTGRRFWPRHPNRSRTVCMPGESESSLRIGHQFRNGHAMVYCFQDRSTFLTLKVSARQSPDDAGEWRIEAHPSDGRSLVVEWGSTRASALDAVSRTWTSRASSEALPSFDWDVVAQALTRVRAL